MPAKRYYEGVRKLCDKYGILLIFDEVLVGFGRTGKWFACEHYGIWPDIMTFAKGVTSSYMPLGGVMVSEAVADKLERIPFRVALTGSFHPVSCAAGYAAINYMQRERVVENAEKVGAYLKKQLKEKILPSAYVEEIRGIGLLQSVLFAGEMNCRSAASAFCDLLKEKGYITWADHTAILIAPPLITTEEQIGQFVNDFRDILLKLESKAYIEKLKRYPREASYGAEAFYALSYMENMADMLRDFQNVLVLGSAKILIVKTVLALVKSEEKKYGLYLNREMYGKLDEEEKKRAVIFDGQRFDADKQSSQIWQIQKEKNYDCVLIPYGRDGQEWENIYEVTKVFGIPAFLIRKDGAIIHFNQSGQKRERE